MSGIGWNSVGAGDSIWIAGGSYGTLSIGKSGATNAPIYIARVRATNTVPAQAAGWSANFDSNVTINRVDATGGYNWWTLDGQIPYSGMAITNDSTGGNHAVSFGLTVASYARFQNLLISGSSTDLSNPGIQDVRCIHANFNGNPTSHGFYVGHCELRYNTTLLITLGCSDMTVEYCRLHSNYRGGTSIHPNVWAVTGGTNVVFRYNEITNWTDEGIMMDFVSTSDAPNDSWEIYGNNWHDELGFGYYGRFLESQYRPQCRIHVYNNTFANMSFGINLANGGTWGVGCLSYNNIFYNVQVLRNFGTGAEDYNLSDSTLLGSHSITNATAGIFVNYTGKDYHIVSNIGASYPRNKGITLGLSYNNVDTEGKIRGADGAWDIGAFEYGSITNNPTDTNAPTVTLTAPQSGTTVTGMVTLTATAVDNVGGSGVASVTFLVDGGPVGTATTTPYSQIWNSASVPNGTHTVKASAVDVAGNQGVSSNVVLTVQNAGAGGGLNQGLVGWWKFNDTSGSTAHDTSGQGNDGTVVAPATWGRGTAGPCLTLNGVNGYVRVPSTAKLEQVSNAVSISVWAQLFSTADMQTIARKVIAENTNLPPYTAYDLVIEDHAATFTPRMAVTGVDSSRGVAYGAGHAYGALYHFVGTYDGTIVRIYVNGVEEGNSAYSGTLLQTSQPLCVGRYGTVGETVSGTIAACRLYNRALFPAEVQTLSERVDPPTGLRIVSPP
jgi:hypothetical protein